MRYTADQLRAMPSEADWARVDAKTDAEIAADTTSDPAWDGIPEDWYKHAKPGLPFSLPKGNKRQVTLRLDPEVLDHFKGEGRGWQSRINAVLRMFVEARERGQ